MAMLVSLQSFQKRDVAKSVLSGEHEQLLNVFFEFNAMSNILFRDKQNN